MHAMAPIRPTAAHPTTVRRARVRTTELQQCRIELVSGPTAPAEARQQVRAVIAVWGIPVDVDTIELLTTELVTNAFLHDAGEWIALAIRYRPGLLRVDVHDSASGIPAQQGPLGRLETVADDVAESGRGLLIIETLADEWGFYRTPTGKAVYFAMGCAG